MNPTVFVLNGPNLNLLGQREPELYGSLTLSDIEARVKTVGASLGLDVEFRQTNHEGVLVDWLQEARTKAGGVILNAGAYTHTSVAVHDAIRAADVPVVEVHLSNVHAREDFRRHSYISSVAVGVIVGFGADGYDFALHALARRIGRSAPETLTA